VFLLAYHVPDFNGNVFNNVSATNLCVYVCTSVFVVLDENNSKSLRFVGGVGSVTISKASRRPNKLRRSKLFQPLGVKKGLKMKAN
jgi:hypothetical protein